MTVYVTDAHAHVHRLVSVVKMATLLEEYTTEEQHSVVLFLWATGLGAKDIHKEVFPVGSVCRVNWFTTGLGNSLKDVRKPHKWLRQQSRDFYAAGSDTLVKRWGKCINVDGGSVEK
jgi:hypothetical protein